MERKKHTLINMDENVFINRLFAELSRFETVDTISWAPMPGVERTAIYNGVKIDEGEETYYLRLRRLFAEFKNEVREKDLPFLQVLLADFQDAKKQLDMELQAFGLASLIESHRRDLEAGNTSVRDTLSVLSFFWNASSTQQRLLSKVVKHLAQLIEAKGGQR